MVHPNGWREQRFVQTVKNTHRLTIGVKTAMENAIKENVKKTNMELYKQINYEGGTLRLFGKYTVAKPSFEGSLPEPSSFNIYSIELPLAEKGHYQDVSELYEDLIDDLERVALKELDSEDIDGDYEEILSKLDESMDMAKRLASVRIPTLYDDDVEDLIDKELVSSLATELAMQLTNEHVIACKIGFNGVRFVYLNNLKELK